MKKSAEFEAKVFELEIENKKYKKDLTTGQLEWTGLRSQLTLEVEETKRVARVRIDAMQEELRTRREKQYAVLSRLQAADEGLRKSQDEQEKLTETCNVLQERLFEMEKETIELKNVMNDEIIKEKNNTKRIENQLKIERMETIKERDGQKGLKRQLQEMAATILKLVEKNKETTDVKLKKDDEIIQRESEMKTLQERVSKLIKETSIEGKARVRAETTAEVMASQLNALRRENNLMHAAVTQSADDWETRNIGLKKRLSRVKSRLNSEAIARRNCMERFFKNATNISGGNQGNTLEKDILNLSNCSMTDSEIKLLSSLFGKNAFHSHRYRTIDLSYNRITDDGIRELTLMIPGGTFCEYIDLSGNMMSGDGARMLADISNQCTALGIQHVYVHQDAKIQALGKRPKRWLFSNDDATNDDEELKRNQSSSPQSDQTGTVLTFDCRNNEPPTNDDINGGLSSVISTNSTGGSSMLMSYKKGKNDVNAKRNEEARNRRLEKAYGSSSSSSITNGLNGGGSSILVNQLRNNSSILSVGGGSGILSSGSSIESQAAASAGNLARRSIPMKTNDRRNDTIYQDTRKSTSKRKSKKTKSNLKVGGSLPNLHS